MSWVKRFFLPLFSAEQAEANLRYGFGNILLTGFLSVVFIFLGIFAGGTVPFFAFYGGAEEFRGFLYNAFIEQGGGICVTVDDGAAITSGGGEVMINTFTDENDRAAYSVNGYHLIVDSRNVASVYDDFTAYCTNTADGSEITYGEYLKLTDKEKQSYRFSVEYTGNEKIIDAESVAQYTEYFDSLPDGNAKTRFKELEEQRAQMTAKQYGDALYVLYVKDYYPDMLGVIGESVPTLRNYYYGLTVGSEGKYYCLFGDLQAASFVSYNGNTVTFGGVYREGNGVDTSGLEGGQARAAVDAFIKNSFRDGLSTAFIFEMMNSLMLIVVTELIIVGAMLFCLCLGKLGKTELFSKFAGAAKLVASYSHTAALFAALAAFCIGFAFSGIAVAVTAYVVFAAILAARTLTLILSGKKETENVQERTSKPAI